MTVLTIVSTILFFLGLDWAVQRMRRGKEADAANPTQPAAASCPIRTPEGIFFSKSHTWLNLFPSGRIRLGVDDLIGSLMEQPKVTFLKKIGDQAEKGDPLFLLEEGDHRLTVRTPLSGEIIALNGELEKSPGRMRETLFSDGWAYAIQPHDLQELKDMLLGRESRIWMFEEFCRLRETLTGTVEGEFAPAHIQDGGAPDASALRQLNSGDWQKLEDEFLRVR